MTEVSGSSQREAPCEPASPKAGCREVSTLFHLVVRDMNMRLEATLPDSRGAAALELAEELGLTRSQLVDDTTLEWVNGPPLKLSSAALDRMGQLIENPPAEPVPEDAEVEHKRRLAQADRPRRPRR